MILRQYVGFVMRKALVNSRLTRLDYRIQYTSPWYIRSASLEVFLGNGDHQ